MLSHEAHMVWFISGFCKKTLLAILSCCIKITQVIEDHEAIIWFISNKLLKVHFRRRMLTYNFITSLNKIRVWPQCILTVEIQNAFSVFQLFSLLAVNSIKQKEAKKENYSSRSTMITRACPNWIYANYVSS